MSYKPVYRTAPATPGLLIRLVHIQTFIGSNSSLVAPVVIGNKTTVGAGSVINKDVDNDNLAIARAKQRNIEGWKRPTK